MKRKKLKQERMKKIIDYLYQNGKVNLTQIAKDLDMPTSTVFDYMKEIEQQYTFMMVRRQKQDW
jgi:DeoR/GlpR family transcriptional regulator of sugar metabolism